MVHLREPIFHNVYVENDEYSSPIQTRNDWIEIPARCECGARASLVLGQHKGETTVAWVLPPERTLRWPEPEFAEDSANGEVK